MDDDKEELKDEIRQLHLEMLRQFQLQQVALLPFASIFVSIANLCDDVAAQSETTKQLRELMGKVQELYSENKALREENARLKSVY